MLRGVSNDNRENLRRVLVESELETSISDWSDIDKFASQIQYVTSRREVSLISKVMAFNAPTRFIAYDRYARKGVKMIMQKNMLPYCYQDYRMAVKAFETSKHREVISNFLGAKHIPCTNKKAFLMRAIDVFLMLRGGRWQTKT